MSNKTPEFTFWIAKSRFPSILEEIQPSLRFQLKILGEYHPFEPSLLQHYKNYVVMTDGFEGLGILLNRKNVCEFEFIVSYKNESSSEVKWTTLHQTMKNWRLMYEAKQVDVKPEDCVLTLYKILDVPLNVS
jgi:hypothetical protein